MDYSKFQYNPLVEKITEILMQKTQNYDPMFFRTQTNFFLSLLPSVMQVKVNCAITGIIPINFYAISLAPSGNGKGFSTNILESKVINSFRNNFMMNTFPKQSALNLELEASSRASINGTTSDVELVTLQKEYRTYGAYGFSYDSATTPALKQLRNKLLLAKCGALNLIVDEIGSNLQNNTEALTTLLELYDKGLVRNKLTKNTETSLRFQELVGSTPTNMLLFGTPSKLFNGSKTEDEFFELLEAGYARRCCFNYSSLAKMESTLTPEEQYDLLTQTNHEQDLLNISTKLSRLSDINLVGSEIDVSKTVGVFLVQYKQDCERRADELPEFQEIQKSELIHRYFKALKLAGAYAFLDGSFQIDISHLQQAIRFVEDSGEALNRMFKREKPHERLAKYIADCSPTELTLVDIQNELPFFKGSQSAKNEMLNMAVAWGYKNNIIIKRSIRDGIEFIKGETLKPSNLENPILSYSNHLAEGYIPAGGTYYNSENELTKASPISFKHLPQLVVQPNYHWCNHWFINGHRKNENVIEGFDLLVLDIDGGTTLKAVQSLMSEYTYIIHTTKRHQVPDENGEVKDRFRMIIPMNYILKLNPEEYTLFMQDVAEWLPFEGLDVKTYQPSRKWACTPNAEVFTNEGKLLDVLPFIPETSRNQEYKHQALSLASLSNLDRWFINKMQVGNRNNLLAQYAFMLLDSGLPMTEIRTRVNDLNSKLTNPLDTLELENTVLKSVQSRGL